MPKLILIKHASPLVEPALPAHEWKLSPAGREKAAMLAERLRAHVPSILFSSHEPKALETAQIVVDVLGIRLEAASDLHEHDRSNVPQMPTREFISSMALFFKRPNERVLGRETAAEGRDRISRAIEGIIAGNSGCEIGIVSHGTVLALVAAPLLEEDPFVLWRRLGLPSFVVFEMPGMRLIERVDSV